MTLLIVYAVLALGVSFLCSLLEASLLSIPNGYVALLVERGVPAGRTLDRMKSHLDRPLSAILTLNTVAHTVGAAGVGAEATYLFGHHVIGAVSAVMTLLILVFSEIIPKTLGAAYAKSLARFTANVTRLLMLITYPLVVALEAMSRVVGYRREQEVQARGEVLAAVRLARQAGTLDAREYRIVSNVLSLRHIRLSEILTPRTVVFALPAEQTVSQVLEAHTVLRYARIPVYRESLDDVLGYVTRFDVYEHHQAGRGDRPLSDLVKPLRVMPEQASVADTLDVMLKSSEHMLLVVDEYGGLEGIATLEDAIETLLGTEIVDETDAAADLQDLARRRANARRRRTNPPNPPRPDAGTPPG